MHRTDSETPSVFSPLAKALMDHFAEAVVLFDPDGHFRFANDAGRRILAGLERDGRLDSRTLLQKLGRLGGRIERLEAATLVVGHAVYLAADGEPGGQHTLADQERRAIVETLNATGWRLTETAHRLGISRTTLWRRLRDYGLSRDGAASD